METDTIKVNYDNIQQESRAIKPNYHTLTAMFNEIAQLAVSHGCEMVTYGIAIEMKSEIETNGNLCSGNLENIISTYQNSFLSTKCAKFTVSYDRDRNSNHIPTEEATKENTSIDLKLSPPIKPNSRNNVPGKHLKSTRKLIQVSIYWAECKYQDLFIAEIRVYLSDKDMENINQIKNKTVKIL